MKSRKERWRKREKGEEEGKKWGEKEEGREGGRKEGRAAIPDGHKIGRNFWVKD